MTGTPSWLSSYVEAAEKYSKQRQAQRDKSEAARAKLRPTTNPVLPPMPKGSKEEEGRRDQPHPLVVPPSFTTPAHPDEWDVRFRFVQAHDHRRREAEKAVKAHREAWEAERLRGAAPHPLIARDFHAGSGRASV